MSTRPALIGFETRLLAELRQVVAERAASGALPAAETHPAVPGPSAPNPAAPNPAARRQAGRDRPHRRLAITGVLSAAGAASLAVVLTVTLSGSGGQLAGPAAPRFVAATTAAAVLNNAALAAQSEPAVTPRPDQFVYLKLLEVDHYHPSASDRAANRGAPPTPARSVDSTDSWTSVSGAGKGLSVEIVRNGNQTAKKYRGLEPWCQDGVARGTLHVHCTPKQFAAYKPWLPSTTAGMFTYLAHTDPSNPNPVWHAGNLVTTAFWLLVTTDLTPAQEAALFHALAKVPHLRVVPGVTDALGRTGIGIRQHDHGDTWTTIFAPHSFRLLGASFTNRSVDRHWAVTVPATVVDRAGQRP